MRIQKRIRNLTQPEQEQFENYLEKKIELMQPTLEAHHRGPDEVHLFAKIQKHEKHTAFAVELILEIPRKRLITGETKHSITEALDFSMQKLEQRLNKHLAKLRKPHRRQRNMRSMKNAELEVSAV